MELTTQKTSRRVHFLVLAKTFSVWSLTLLVSLLVIGFPFIVLMALFGAFLSMILHTLLPMSSVLLVAGLLVGGHLLAIFGGAGFLTFKGIHPENVRWLSWLNGKAEPNHNSVYAFCPLTCSLVQ
jgi:uncharacterized membrane protein (DUF485 family)